MPLLVADSNLSGTKGDLFVTRHYALSATVDARGGVQDRLTLTYHDPVEPVPANAALLVNTGGLYEDYVRVYLPPSANFEGLLVSENGAPARSESPEDLGVEDGRPYVAFDLILDVNGTTALTFALWRSIRACGTERGGQLSSSRGSGRSTRSRGRSASRCNSPWATPIGFRATSASTASGG